MKRPTISTIEGRPSVNPHRFCLESRNAQARGKQTRQRGNEHPEGELHILINPCMRQLSCQLGHDWMRQPLPRRSGKIAPEQHPPRLEMVAKRWREPA